MDDIVLIINLYETIKKSIKYEDIKKIAEDYGMDDSAKIRAIKAVCKDDVDG